MNDETTTPKRRTKRRYAHELYPPPADHEIRPLSVEVPYLYADALGWAVTGTGWMTSSDHGRDRFHILVRARRIALMADAMLLGRTGDKAWRCAEEHADESGELVWDRAVHYGVPADAIKPYECGLEPDEHYCEPSEDGWRINVPGKESECPHCTEVVE